MNHIKALYYSRAIVCVDTDVYKGGLGNCPTGPHVRRLYSELDHLTGLRRKARKVLVAWCCHHSAAKVLLKAPTLGGYASRS